MHSETVTKRVIPLFDAFALFLVLTWGHSLVKEDKWNVDQTKQKRYANLIIPYSDRFVFICINCTK